MLLYNLSIIVVLLAIACAQPTSTNDGAANVPEACTKYKDAMMALCQGNNLDAERKSQCSAWYISCWKMYDIPYEKMQSAPATAPKTTA